MKLITMINKLSDKVDSVLKNVVFIAISGMIIVTTLQIVCRIFFDSLTWSEEVARYLLVWATFLGATLAYKRGLHISITFLVELFPKTIRKVILIIGNSLSMVFFATISIFGIKYINMQIYQVSAALRMPMKYVYVVMVVAFIVFFIHALNDLVNIIFNTKEDQ